MIGKVLGKKSLFAYLGTIIAGALSFGLLIDYVLPIEWFTQIANQHLAHSHGEHLAWWQILSGIILMALIINGYIQKRLNNKHKVIQTNNTNIMKIQTIKVDGMTCNHCKANVESNLEKLAFVETAKVNLAEKTVTIEGDNVEMEMARETITSLGYNCK